jgi:hypothetical protein
MLRRILGQNKSRAGEKEFPSASDKSSLFKGEGLGECELLTGRGKDSRQTQTS